MKVTIHCEGTPNEIAEQLKEAASVYSTTLPAEAKPGKKAKPAEEAEEAPEAEEASEAADDDFGVEDEAPKAKKAKKETTLDDVRKALKEYAAENSREKAISVLKKFKVKSVLDLDPKQYADVLAALA